MSRPNGFAGALAPLVFESMHPKSFLTGTLVLGLVAGSAWVARAAGLPGAAAALGAAVFSVVVARIALNVAQGDRGANLFSSAGGDWGEVLVTALRMMVINLVWTIPVGFVFANWADGFAAVPRSGPAVLLLFAAGLVPPLAAIFAVGADSFGRALAPATWQRLLGGRADELITLLAVCLGGTLAAAAAAYLVFAGLGGGNAEFGNFLALVGGAWTLGASVHLVGGLGGAFVRSAQPARAGAPSSAVRTLRPSDFDPHPSADGQGSGPYLVFGAPEPVERLIRATASGPNSGPGSRPDSGPASGPTSGVVSGVVSRSVSTVSSAVDSALVRAQAATSSRPSLAIAEFDAASGDAESVLGRLRANLRIEEDDRDLALEDAEHLVGKFGPHPQVLTRVAVLQHRLGLPTALETACRAAEAARLVNNAGVLADLYEEFREELDGLEFADVEQQRMAASLVTRGHYDTAIDLYDAMLMQSPQSLPVVKAMIQLAEEGLRTDEGAERALRIYTVIESHWTEHPFVDFVDRGREEARRRRERAMN